ncbi:hypothetical protein F4815DRAFT_454201 [Daldinia loculata]|uniref:uncharacterized protein n=1 Tax=Daldinia loculata TaxID=103429 RepID=UPI0020C439ED|nr:uncharacterized protein F4817DRAFT_330187 [Daldinia loculata]KAI1649806.1 hypothetical protein F4817DRAFT_330187 [Daldinia loculata]KAI2784780.1 hypothetical protein F4815DRAFT_454201 [Daldinia loculata]
MPGLTLNTSSAARAPTHPPSQTPAATANPSTSANTQDPARPSSPPRPTYSPITPPLNPVAFPPRPTYTHSSQQDQVGIAPPPPEPIDFDSNPDVLALKSAISILQLQRRKAAADMALLSRVKTAALAEPEAFVRDLTTGRVGMEGDALYGGNSSAAYDDDDDDDDDDDEDDEMEDTQSNTAAAGQPAPSTTSHASSSGNRTLTDSLVASHSEIKSDPDATEPEPPHHHQHQPNPQSRPWTRLPKPQNVVRCPPINWAQYAVVGESLDKLHSEQISRPAQGVPAAVGPDGRYEFKGEPGRQEKLVGVAAPYAPGKDRIERKPKGPKR